MFMKVYQQDHEPSTIEVVTEFVYSTVPSFFGKLVGNPHQWELESEHFSSASEYLISRTMPEDLRNNCLSILRTVMDFSFSEQFYDKYGVNQEFLTRRVKQYLWGSRKLLQDQVIEQIPEFSEHLRTGVKSFDFDKIEIEFCDNYKATVEPKTSGVEFGEILSLKLGDETIVSYFIKGFTGYPIRNHCHGSEDVWFEEEFFDEENSFSSWYYPYPKLKDALAYKLLESFGLGPHVEFVINPYISRGFYIATRDLTYGDQTFRELESELIKTLDLDYFILLHYTQHPEEFIGFKERITTIDIIGRILCLADLNKGNIRFLLKGSNKHKPSYFLRHTADLLPQIIDFKVFKMPEWLREYYGNQFRIGENHGEYKGLCIIPKILQCRPDEEKFLMGYKAIKNIKEMFENLKPAENQNSLEDNDEAILREFLKQKADEVKAMFLKRRDDLPVLRNRTNAELIGFEFKSLSKLKESKDSKDSKDNKCEEHKHVKYIEDSFEELDKYCEDIILNYQTLKKYINDGYHEYYDDEGNLIKHSEYFEYYPK
ncbi:hypothetical protein TVAG_339130 [Trichomonas vaginalis G3]|uniref:Uncharacterized protein n=2 Tax=Trichomonas vaginalis (strain ATCC PRA-98 / G3) TaxID=412133 RepID=A2FMS6_TRIV3|nr:hypothetical protein TVAG_339130 [Trichomonas vaginalis G3]|eukprot:XP_001306720.1 hypothetical protein [Trichomonas vaginalis G3]